METHFFLVRRPGGRAGGRRLGRPFFLFPFFFKTHSNSSRPPVDNFLNTIEQEEEEEGKGDLFQVTSQQVKSRSGC